MSTTLRAGLAMFALLLASCGDAKKQETSDSPKASEAAKASDSGVKKYQMKGEVLSVDMTAHTAKIKHEKIEGWMDAMTMDYPIKDAGDLTKVAPGQSITATVFVNGPDYWVGEIGPGKP